MPSVVLRMGGIEIPQPDAETLRKVVFSKDYWQGYISNTAVVSLRDDINVCIVICYHQQHGFYLHYFDSAHEEWVSVGDKSKLAEIVEHCGDGDGPVSLGLFVSAQKA